MEILLIQVACACRRSHAKCVTSTFSNLNTSRQSIDLLSWGTQQRQHQPLWNGQPGAVQLIKGFPYVGSLLVDRRVEKDTFPIHNLPHCKIGKHVKACPLNNPICMYIHIIISSCVYIYIYDSPRSHGCDSSKHSHPFCSVTISSK